MQPTEGIRISNCFELDYHFDPDIYGICNIDEQCGSSVSLARSLHNGALPATELWYHGKGNINTESRYVQTCNMLTGLTPNKMTNHARSAPKLTLGLLPACLPSCTLNVLNKSVYQTTRSVNKVMRLIQYNSVLTFKLQIELSPSNQFPWEATHLWRRCSHSSQQRQQSLTGIAFSWSVTAFSMFSTVPKWRPLR